MKGAYIVTEGDLTLREITPETAQTAAHTIILNSTGPGDCARLMEMIQPRAYTATTVDPSARRAAPRRGLEA